MVICKYHLSTRNVIQSVRGDVVQSTVGSNTWFIDAAKGKRKGQNTNKNKIKEQFQRATTHRPRKESKMILSKQSPDGTTRDMQGKVCK